MEKWKGMIEILDMLKIESDELDKINDKITEQENDFQKIENNYIYYNNLIEKGNNTTNNITNREYYETLILYFGFYFFFGCVIYVLLKRIPIHKIIMYFFEITHKIINFNKNNDL